MKLLKEQLKRINDADDMEEVIVEESVMDKEDYKEMIKENHLHVIDITEEEKIHREEDREEALADLDITPP